MTNSATRQKVDQSLRYRWGVVGVVLPALIFAWYLYTNWQRLGTDRDSGKAEWMKNFVKIVCPRCNNEPDKIKGCTLCNGLGYIWVDRTKDFPKEVVIP